MTCSRILGPFTKHLVAERSTWKFEPCTPWMPAMGIRQVRTLIRNLATTTTSAGNRFTTRTAVQVAGADPAEPLVTADVQGVEPWDTGGTAWSGNGEWTDQVNINGLTEDKYFVRIGIAYRNETSGAGVVTQGTVVLLLDVSGLGDVVGTDSAVLESVTTDAQFRAFTAWVPARDVTVAKFAVVQDEVSGGGGTGAPFLETAVAVQTARVDPESPNAWALIEASPTWRSGDRKQCTGELPVGSHTSADFWVRFGLGYRVTTGNAWGAAELSVSVACRG